MVNTPTPGMPPRRRETSETGDNLKPRVASQVLGCLRSDHTQVPKQRRLHSAEQARESRFVTGLRTGQGGPEPSADHPASIGPRITRRRPNRHSRLIPPQHGVEHR